MKLNKTFRPVLIALSVMLLGLFMLCAHNQTIETPGEDLAGGDDEFRQELMDMLDLSEGDEDVQEFAAGDAALEQPNEENVGSSSEEVESAELSGDDEADLMALLAGIEEEADDGEATMPEESEQFASNTIAEVETSDNQPNYYTDNLLSEVERLEIILNQRSEQVDSLRRIIDNRNARLADLQSRRKTGVPARESTPLLADSRTPAPAQAVASSQPSNVGAYNSGRSHFESFNYNDCIESMSDVLSTNSNSPLADNAQYWIGESYFGLKQYQKAILEFQKVFSFNATDKYDDAQLMIGLCYVRLGQGETARSTFGEFLQTYEGSEYRSVAQRYYQNI
jgi:TolA-binding protein